MMVSTRGRYALRVLIDLAEHDNGAYIPLRDIAERQEISEKYLESIISVLTKAGYLDGLRGKGGGYRLTRPPEDYTVGGILKLTEGSLAPVACLGNGGGKCARAGECKTLPMWEKFHKITDDYFEGISLRDLTNLADGGSYEI